MKKLIHLLVTLFTSVSFAASGTIPTKFNTDTVQFGHSGSVANHNLIYDFGLAGLNPALAVDSATKTLKYNKNFFQIGAGSAANESYAFNIGAGANNPNIRWNSSLSKLQFSNDGTAFKTFNLGTDILSGAATNGQVLTADGSGGTLFAAGSGGGGSKNYLSTVTTTNGTNVGNGNFETGTTSGWVLGNTTVSANGLPTGTPTFGSGADANLTFSAVTANRLSGTYSGSYNSSTSTVQGNFVSTVPFNIDSQDQAKVLSVKIYYSAISGAAGADFSGTNLNSFGLAIYDVTAGAWVDSFAGNFGIIQGSGAGYATATFQTNLASTQYRFVLYNAHPTAAAINLLIDDVVVGPNVAPSGVIPKSSTKTIYLTGSGTYTVPQGVYQIKVKMAGGGGGGSGSGTSGGTPGGAGGNSTFGSSLLAANGGAGGIFGVYGGAGGAASIGTGASGLPLSGGTGGGTSSTANSTPTYEIGGVGGTNPFGGAGQSSSSTSGLDGVTNSGAGGGGGGNGLIGNAASGNGGGAGGYVDAIVPSAYLNAHPTISYSVGVGGTAGSAGPSGYAGGRGGDGVIEITEDYLGANVELSSDTDTRVVAFNASGTSNTTTASTVSPLFFNSINSDTHGGYQANGSWTVPVTGFYDIAANFAASATNWAAGQRIILFVQYAGQTTEIGRQTIVASGAPVTSVSGALKSIKLFSGQQINLAVLGDVAVNIPILNFSISRQSGPAVVAASEKVLFTASDTAGSVIAANATVPFANVSKDTHNAFSSGRFKCPISGDFFVAANIYSVTAAQPSFGIFKNGVDVISLYGSNITQGGPANTSGIVSCLAGDFIDVRSLSGSSQSLTNTAAANTLSIHFVK